MIIDYYSVGQRIKKYRKAYQLSQEELADKVGISVTHLSHIENGNTKLSLQVLVDISDCLLIDVDILLKGQSSDNRTRVSEQITTILDNCSIQESHYLLDILSEMHALYQKHIQ